MSLPDIDFKLIREHEGSRDRAFEELCCQIAADQSQGKGTFHRKGRGADAGVECFSRSPGGQETGWQVKYYWKMDSSLIASLNDSIERALAKHPDLVRYIICIPFDLPDPRTGTTSAIDVWNGWREHWVGKAAVMKRGLEIELCSASRLKKSLVQDGQAGRILFWFSQQLLTSGWFRAKFQPVKEDLGSRYTATTNVALPIRRALLGMVRDPALGAAVDEWVENFSRNRNAAIRALERFGAERSASVPAEFLDALNEVRLSFDVPIASSAEPFPLNAWRVSLATSSEKVWAAYGWVREIDPTPKVIRDEVSSRDAAVRALDELGDCLEKIQTGLRDPLWSQVNAHQVLIHGPGGIGKSHLLADMASYQLDRGRPAVMLLGQHFADDDPWPQIIRRLDFPAGTTKEQFLGAMDAAAQAVGIRGLIVIDALNEKHGVRLWHDRLAGFLHALAAYPHLKVILSCRTTYLPHVISELLDEKALPRLKHHGFGVADARAYLSMRKMVLPGAPVPAPGFDNPLFLKTCCDALELDSRREFPRGLNGPTAIFEFYRTAIGRQVHRRLNLDERRDFVGRAIRVLAEEIVTTASESVPVPRVLELFDQVLPSQGDRDRDLLVQLESEGMLTTEVESGGEEAVRFTFQRFSDHIVAGHLLSNHMNAEDPARAFAAGGALQPYVSPPLIWERAGVLEAMATQVPERFGRELPDLIPQPHPYPLREAFKASLLARAQRCFTDRTMELVEELLGSEQILLTLLHITGEAENRFNALFLHVRLAAMSVPERDAQWSAEIAHFTDDDDPVMTLINWAWSSGFDVIDETRAELSGITLTWFLTTNSRIVRDRASKALAALLAPRPKLAVALLERFWAADDDYLRERLLAAIYGALLQGGATKMEIGAVAHAVYRLVFADGSPPINALLRDHARWIVEYGDRRKCLPADVDIDKARPPYQSPWPLEAVPDDLIEQYQQTYRTGARLRDSIVSSAVQDGDFARHVIDAHVRNWSPAPIGSTNLPTHRDLFDSWLAEFSASASAEAVKAFKDLLECQSAVVGQGRWEKTPEREAMLAATAAFRATLTPEAWEDYRSRSGAWRGEGMFNYRAHGPACFDFSWARRWVCMRAHALGWSEEVHGEIDVNIRGGGRTSHRVERIGKKYQWLALYELGARLADNCAFMGDRYDASPTGRYDGESFGSLRDLDPSLLVRSTNDDGWSGHADTTWWAPIRPTFAMASNEDRLRWLYGNRDLIDGLNCIEVTDPDGRQWLTLEGFVTVTEKVSDDDQAYRDSWSRLRCVIVRKVDLKRLVSALAKERLQDPSALPAPEFYSSHYYFGEYPWHPAVSGLGDWENLARSSKGRTLRIRGTTGEYVCERGNYDYSIDDTVRILLPAPWLAEQLGLRLSDGRRATYVDQSGEMMFFDPALAQDGPHAGLVDREAFLANLERQDLAAVWVIAGEKSVHAEHGDAFGGEASFASIYWHADGQWQSRTMTSFLAPSPDQIKGLFGENLPTWVRTEDR